MPNKGMEVAKMTVQELRFSAFGLTDVGRVRTSNEDRFRVCPELELCIVADGMGGANAGEVAAEMACNLVTDYVRGFAASDRVTLLEKAVRLADRAVYRASVEDSQCNGMGTTVVSLIRSGDAVAIVHVGDSRCYLSRNGVLQRLTTDHTLAQLAASLSGLTVEQYLEQRPDTGHVLTSAVGTDPHGIELGIRVVTVQVGDKFLLCSDGLVPIGDERIQEVLSQDLSPESAATQLVALANAEGGHDNTTVIVIHVVAATEERGI